MLRHIINTVEGLLYWRGTVLVDVRGSSKNEASFQ